MSARIHFLQPYIPTYRVPFFERLVEAGRGSGIEIVVYAGAPKGMMEARADRATGHRWEHRITHRVLRIGGRRFAFPRVDRGFFRHADGIVVGLEGTLPQAYSGLLLQARHRLRLGVWGHIRPYTTPGNPIDLAAERFLMRHASQVFAYTPGGAAYAIEHGTRPERITTTMNTIDTGDAEMELSDDEIGTFRATLGLDVQSRVFAFIGGLDMAKRVDFLAAVLDAVEIADPSARFLIAGRGADERLLDRAVARGQALRLGPANGEIKARVGAVSEAFIMPGRIGLVAVDALALGIPIVSTDWAFHAPEIEYLTMGDSLFFAPNDPVAFARFLLDHRFERRRREYPGLDDMVGRFLQGLQRMLGD